ncbi:hypothetical protein GWI33_004655 [Rhynchophorus ferrugineus]|uniref:TGF-beta propeptide domain-containing protein n=1 Tax=Rhynchophorus ferrugineus TaxID=354439 RepID=A0A834MP30_RHYFE|nr:hypothetical protein GWI33_004655 [Rhynchophorus ferrugineus]
MIKYKVQILLADRRRVGKRRKKIVADSHQLKCSLSTENLREERLRTSEFSQNWFSIHPYKNTAMYQQTISIQLAPILRIAILLTILLTNAFVWTAPSNKPSVSEFDSKQEFEDALNNFLNIYYDEIVSKHNHDIHDLLKQTFQRNDVTESYHSNKAKRRSLDDDSVEDYQTNNGKKSFSNAYDTDIYDQMQGDQPVTEDTDSTKVTADPMTITRERLQRDLDERLRKENWVEYLKTHILNHIGRSNSTFTKPPEDPPLTDFNVTDILPKILNTTMFDDDQITEKIRSFYPSCEIPQNQQDQQDSWKDEDVMNLYFNFDYHSDNKNINIATATLRLYRLPQNGTNFTAKKDDCDNLDSVEEDKLLRVSVYWYTKYQKKRRVKKRLSDSKVISENAHWVELSVKPATKAWNKAGARNLGLGIQVEDQEGKTLKADRYFKGASCTQPPNQSLRSYVTPPISKQTNVSEFIAYLQEIQHQPYIVTYNCSPQ